MYIKRSSTIEGQSHKFEINMGKCKEEKIHMTTINEIVQKGEIIPDYEKKIFLEEKEKVEKKSISANL